MRCFSFPVNLTLRQRWIEALHRKNFEPSKSAVVCSKHFRDEDVDRTSLSIVHLRADAVPSVFDAFPSYLQLKARGRKPPKERSTPSTSAAASNVLLSSPAAAAQSTASDVPVYVLDCSLSEVEETPTPRKTALKRKLCHAEGQLRSCRKRIKVLMQSKRRLQKRNADSKAVIDDMRKKDISSESLSVLQNAAGGVNDLIKRRATKQLGTPCQVPYSPELRTFARTLHFYSPHAYRYVRKMFDTCLPHPRTITKW